MFLETFTYCYWKVVDIIKISTRNKERKSEKALGHDGVKF